MIGAPVLRWFQRLAAALLLALTVDLAAAQSAKPEAQFPLASRIGLAPPPGMSVSASFQGFEDEKNNIYIRVVSMPDKAYAEIEKSMTNQALKKQNLTVERRESFKLPSGKGILIVARQEAENVKLRKWLLIAPVGGLTAMLSLEIPLTAKDVYSEAAIRASFATLTSRATIPAEEQLALVPFSLRDLAGFRVAGLVPGRALHLSDGGSGTDAPLGHANLAISVGAGGPSTVADRESFARLAFAGPPTIRDVRVVSAEPLRIGGQPGHELRATGKDTKTGAEIEIVQWLRFGSGAYLLMLGFAPKDDWVGSLARFRTVRDGIDPR